MQQIHSETVYPDRLRHGNAASCQSCGKPLTPKRAARRQRFCNSRCKDEARRGRNNVIWGVPAIPVARATIS